jgi:hypothetical protein
LITIEAAMPELPDLNSPEFVAITARLARTYLTHKADLGVPFAYYAEIVTRASSAHKARACRSTAVRFGIFAIGKLPKRRLVQPTGRVLFCPLSASAFNRGLGDGRVHRVAEPESHAAVR